MGKAFLFRLLAVIFLSFLAAGCCCDYLTGSVSPGAVTEKLVTTTLEDCDFEAALPYVDKTEKANYAALTSGEKNAAKVMCLALDIKITKFEVLSETISGDTATVAYSVCLTSAGKEQCHDSNTARFVKEDGQWKLHGDLGVN